MPYSTKVNILFAMKLSKFSLLIFALFVPSLFFSEQALALPWKQNCASLQSFANALDASNQLNPLYNFKTWTIPTKFSGFEGRNYIDNIGGLQLNKAICEGGYVKETSPMGTRICRATLLVDGTGMEAPIGRYGVKWIPESCRWM